MTNPEAYIDALLATVERDPRAAAELLGIAADYLEAGQPMPRSLARHLFLSFRRAIAQPSAERATTLTVDLGLAPLDGGGRPAKPVDRAQINAMIERKYKEDGGISENAASEWVAEEFGVSVSTARKHVKPERFIPEILKDNGFDSLIPVKKPGEVLAKKSRKSE